MASGEKIKTQALIPQDWPESILDTLDGDLSRAQRVMWLLVLYGSGNTNGEVPLTEDDLEINTVLKMKCKEIDKMKQESLNKYSNSGGSSTRVDSALVAKLKGEGLKAKEIGEIIGEPTDRVFNCRGWRLGY